MLRHHPPTHPRLPLIPMSYIPTILAALVAAVSGLLFALVYATQRYRAAIAAPLATNTQQHPSRAEQAEQKARVWVVAKEGAK